MRQSTVKKLRKLAARRYPDPKERRIQFRAMKRDWLATPWNQRAKTLTILDGLADLMEEAAKQESATLADAMAATR